eukprot:1629125-Rhodomonas_salina.1
MMKRVVRLVREQPLMRQERGVPAATSRGGSAAALQPLVAAAARPFVAALHPFMDALCILERMQRSRSSVFLERKKGFECPSDPLSLACHVQSHVGAEVV